MSQLASNLTDQDQIYRADIIPTVPCAGYATLKACPDMDFLMSNDITTRSLMQAHKEQDPGQDHV